MNGFSVGFQGPPPGQCGGNLISTWQHPDVVTRYCIKELSLGRIAGPFVDPPFANLVTNPVGVVAKKAPGEFRVIHHLSHPVGRSINDGIAKECSTVHYASVDDAIRMIRDLGPGCFLANRYQISFQDHSNFPI